MINVYIKKIPHHFCFNIKKLKKKDHNFKRNFQTKTFFIMINNKDLNHLIIVMTVVIIFQKIHIIKVAEIKF